VTIEELRNKCTPLKHGDESMYDASHRVSKTRINRDLLFIPLLAVAEAADKYVRERNGPVTDFTMLKTLEQQLRTALADFDKAREAM
jgi:hypothetical protein